MSLWKANSTQTVSLQPSDIVHLASCSIYWQNNTFSALAVMNMYSMFILYKVLYVMTILDGWQVLAGHGA